ncbi:hypothetical protein MTR67_008807 [Solanum verrucosum]|uniref:Endonuclease/exonuclease/phosphatase domain-containing protein n=1 Tax=Solanum verrucosum TaxID=315347 RepID=A0AAF0Q301_SOLVR|nr:hypothetical protein MTR67_008807 [Solanum verrucosum]
MTVKIISWNVRGLNQANKRCVIKNLIQGWKADVYCFQETKIQGDVRNIIKDLWSNRGVEFCQLLVFTGKSLAFTWVLTGIYAPNSREERKEVWWEVGSARGLFNGSWAVCGDFNTVRFPSEKKNCSRITKSMTDLSDFIEAMSLLDLQLAGGRYTWRKGDKHDIAARLDRFLVSDEWNGGFKNIKQSILQKVTSDHSPILLQCGNWEPVRSYFKFESWWLLSEGFLDRVKEWWRSFDCEGRPYFILAFKLKALKVKLREWSKSAQGNLALQKQNIVNQLAEFEKVQDQRALEKRRST